MLLTNHLLLDLEDLSEISKVDRLFYEHWAKIVRSENISTPIYVECNKIYQSMVCVQEFWYIAT